jgi:hypothetical protein
MKNIYKNTTTLISIAMAFVSLFSLGALATMPGDEDLSSQNILCSYEKYKNREPDWCPRVERVNYGFTVYGDHDLQIEMEGYLLLQMKKYSDNSKRGKINFKKNGSFRLYRPFSFEMTSDTKVPDEKYISLEFGSSFIPVGDRFIVSTVIIFSSNQTNYVVSDASEISAIKAGDKYLKDLVDKYLKLVFSPTLFPDAIHIVDQIKFEK